MAEANRFWPSVPEEDQWSQRLRSACPQGHYSVSAFNSHEKRLHAPGSHQFGGVLATVLNQSAHRIKEGGRDPSGLGRWAWFRLQGKKQVDSDHIYTGDQRLAQDRSKDLVVVSAYRPNESKLGAHTVYSQHRVHWLQQGRDTHPIKAFDDDLLEALSTWMEDGCEVILGMDCNEDLVVPTPKSLCPRLADQGLREVLLERHAQLASQPTFHRNMRCHPIDGIFATPGVEILAGGYYAFDEYFPSTHRGLWIDIDLQAILGELDQAALSRHSARRLRCDCPSAASHYIKEVEREFDRFHIPQRLARLAQDVEVQNGELSRRQKRMFDTIHAQAYSIRRKAERHCRKLRMGGVPWSPTLQDVWNRLEVWRTLIKSSKGCHVSSRRLRRLLVKSDLVDAWKLDPAELEEARQLDRRKLTVLKKSAEDLRASHISNRRHLALTKKHRSPKPSAATEVKQRLRHMQQREDARRRRRAMGKNFGGGLCEIQVETQPSAASAPTLVTCSTQELVEEGCIVENTERYDQTRAPFATPPMMDPTYSIFTGPDGRQHMNAVLEGSFDLLLVPAGPMRLFLSECVSPIPYNPPPFRVTLDDHVWFWEKMPETKSSEPHGLHNGHYKVGATSPSISACDAIFRDIPVYTGSSPLAWQSLMNVAIEKKPGEIRVTKMRTIQLMNAEFNANNKKIGKEAMAFAEAHSLIPPGQCGSRKNHRAIDLAVSKRLLWDLLLLNRRAAGWVCNDAKSCYDRIVHWVAVLSLLRFGMPWGPVNSMFSTLQQSTHRVRTGFGDSQRSFTPPTDVPFQGCGQGNGAGPTMWVAISSILISMMATAGFGLSLLSALSCAVVVANCLSFVDDTDLVHAAAHSDTSGVALLPDVQRAVNLWSGGISATGGALNPEKSFWWLLDFVWDPLKGKWRFATEKDAPGELTLVGPTGVRETLTRVDPGTARETLGVFMAPDGNQEAQLSALTSSGKKWATHVQQGFLLQRDVLPMLKTTILKTFEYPMALTTFSARTWAKIMQPIIRTCLPKAGVCRNFPRAAVYGSPRYLGLGIPHPFAMQVTTHLETLLRHGTNQTPTGVLLSSALESHQLELGLPWGLFQVDYDQAHFLTSDTWLKELWKEMWALDVHLSYRGSDVQLRATDDDFLMNLFMDEGYGHEDLLWLNRCREYLRATSVADIVTADGLRITPSAWSGTPDPHRLSAYQWPRSACPSPTRWRLWRKALETTVLGHGGSSLKLSTPLGVWTDSLDCWSWFHSLHDRCLYQRVDGRWWRYNAQSTRRNNFTRSALALPVAPPPLHQLRRATVDELPSPALSRSFHLTGIGVASPSPSSQHATVADAWRDLRANAPDDWLPERMVVDGDEAKVARALEKGSLRIVSDGSFKQMYGAAAVRITTRSMKHSIWITCQTPGLPDSQSAYRSELAGILAALSVVHLLAQVYKVSGSATFACDGKSALDNAFSDSVLHPKQAQFDVLSAIRGIRDECPVTWSTTHVMGHADRLKPWSQLTWWERRNVEVDLAASKYCDELILAHVEAPNPWFKFERWALFVHGVKQSRLDPRVITDLVTLPPLRDYWATKDRLSGTSFDSVDWPAVDRAMTEVPDQLSKWVTKHTVGMCSVGKFRKIWGWDDTNSCPRCGQEEDHRHVVTCTHDSASEAWKQILSEFDSWLLSSGTDPTLHRLLLKELSTFRGVAGRHLSLPTAHALALRDQRSIDPYGLPDGLISSKWTPIQARHYQSTGSRRSAPKWAASLVKELWLIGFKMWEHRNTVKFSDESFANRRLSRQVNGRIRRALQNAREELPRNLHPLLLPLNDLLAKSLHDREAWLTRVLLEKKAHTRHLARRRNMMREFFSLPNSN